MTTSQVILILAIVAAAALLQAFMGFGMPILMMAVLPFFLEYSKALALANAVGLISTFYVAVRFRKHIRLDILAPMLIPSVIIQAAATVISVKAAGKILFILLGFLLIVLSLYFLIFADKIVIKPTRRLSLIIGCVCGFSSGLFAICGPQAALYLLPSVKDKKEYLATIQAFFALSNLEAVILRAWLGTLTVSDMPLLCASWAAMLTGTGIGFILFKNVPTGKLKKAVYLFIGICGAWIIISHLAGLA